MQLSWRARPGRCSSILVAMAAFAVVLAWAAPTFAVTLELGGPVYESQCTYCHATIADSKKGAEIKFYHAYHLTYACAACHTEFPHAAGRTAVPKMAACFACHNLRHGPQGKLAKGECEVCHNTPRAQLKPTANSQSAPDHFQPDWAGKAHVAPSLKNYRTQCMMCHDQKSCDTCHAQKGVTWTPTQASAFDGGQNCQVCHGQSILQKPTAQGIQSFQVVGVEASAHGKLSCMSCHVDFKYYDGADATKLWEVNAGLGCRACHQGQVPGYEKQTQPFQKVVNQWETSIHAQKLFAGNLQSATCSSCHSGHDIQRLDTADAKAAFHANAYKVCARCHLDKYKSYDDYYHGAAYKKGAGDAPACWECHDSHLILPSSDKNSATSAENLPKTCGGQAAGHTCHKGSLGSENNFAAAAKNLIHQKTQVQATNPIEQLVAKIKSWFS
jgi:hypothetical protein